VSSTLAGQAGTEGSADGTGSAARFSSPGGLALDGSGHLFVADSGNHAIRMIVIATGAVTTFAGTSTVSGSTDGALGTGRFYYPRGLTSLGGVLYVSDTNNCTIRAVNGAGVISTLAGSAGLCGSADGTGAAARFNYPQGLTSGLTLGGPGLFVADTFSHTIRWVTTAGVVGTELGAAGSAGFVDSSDGSLVRFYYPTDVTYKASTGRLYIADSWNNAIRSYTGVFGSTTTFAGDGQPGTVDRNGTTATVARFRTPSGIAYDATADYLWVTDQENFTVRGIDAVAGTSMTLSSLPNSADGIGAAGRFYQPGQIATDGATLYLTDPMNNAIRKIAIATGAVTTIAGGVGSGLGLDSPNGVTVTTDGATLFVTDTGNHLIRRIDLATGTVTPFAGDAGHAGSVDAPGLTARFNYPNGLTTDGTNLFVADTGNQTIRKIAIASGVVTTLAGMVGVSGHADGTGASASFNEPLGLTTDGTNLYVADSQNDTIRRIVIATGAVTTLAGTAGSAGTTDASGAAARFHTPHDLSTDGTKLYVTDWGNQTIRTIVIASGAVTTLAGNPGTAGAANGTGAAATFRFPGSVTNTDSRLYVTDAVNATVRAIQ
jgi:sugar lactone lactonase YvrE